MKAVGFELESQMCEVLKAALAEALMLPDASRVWQEVQVGAVIPDLVAVSHAPASAGPPISGFESWIIADMMRARTRRPETLARRLFTQPERLRVALARLVKSGILDSTSDDSFCLATNFMPTGTEVVAVEAKLSRWREAINQATTYLSFANRAFVALPADRIEGNPEIVSACRVRRIGLIAVNDSTAWVVRAAPRHAPAATASWVWLVARAARGDLVSARKPLRERRAMPADG